jgi:hypothetical protein
METIDIVVAGSWLYAVGTVVSPQVTASGMNRGTWLAIIISAVGVVLPHVVN